MKYNVKPDGLITCVIKDPHVYNGKPVVLITCVIKRSFFCPPFVPCGAQLDRQPIHMDRSLSHLDRSQPPMAAYRGDKNKDQRYQ